MTIYERAKDIPNEALTNHHIHDDSIEFTPDDLSNAYIAGAQDVITLIMAIINMLSLKEETDYKKIVDIIVQNIEDINKF